MFNLQKKALAAFALSLSAISAPATADEQAASVSMRPVQHKQVWCAYMPWVSLQDANHLFLEMYDVPLAHPSGDRLQDLRSEMLEAGHGGIDVFLEDLPRLEAFVPHLKTMLNAADGTPVKIGILLDGVPKGDTPGGYAKKAGEILQKIGDNPALARVDGKPLMTTFWAWRWPPEFWKEFRQHLRQDYQQEIFLVGDPNTQWNIPATTAELSTYAGCFDQFYAFSETTDRGGKQSLAETYRIIAQAGQTPGIANGWTGAIAPGYNGGWYLRGRNDFYSPFMGFDRFWDMWQLSMANGAAHMQLTTWNDMDERWFQPSIFQFHTYLELNRYWTNHWRGTADIAANPRIYLAYQREQMLGTLQRIEVVSLPTSAADTLTISGEIHDVQGHAVFPLPPLNVPANEACRREWWVPTAALAASPALEPVVRVSAGGREMVRHMPMFRLRTGWIANQIVVKAPVHEMAEGTAALSIHKMDERTIEATVSIDSPERVRHVSLWRDDRPVGSFARTADAGTVYGLLWEPLKQHKEVISFTNSQVLQAYQVGAADSALPWKQEGFTATLRPADYLAVNLQAQESAEMTVTRSSGPPQIFRIAALLKDPLTISGSDGTAIAKIRLAPIDPLAAIPLVVDERSATLRARFNVDQCLAGDLFYVRCETADGHFFYSPAIVPFAGNTKPVRTNILQTAMSLDQGGFQVPHIDEGKVLATEVPAALLQHSLWEARDATIRTEKADHQVVINTLGRDLLHLGSGGAFYKTAVSRVPEYVTLPDGRTALSFDGVDDIAELPCRQIPIGAFTVEMEIYPQGPLNRPQTLLGHAGWMSCPIIRLLADGTVEAGRDVRKLDDAEQPIRTTGQTLLTRSHRPLRPDEWATIKVTFDESNVRLYVNGELSGQAAGVAGRAYGNNHIFIGGPVNPFHGKIASIRISSYAEDLPR